MQDAFLDGFGGVYWWEENPTGAWEITRRYLFETDILSEEVLSVYALHPLNSSVDAYMLNNFAGPDTAQLFKWRGAVCDMLKFKRVDYHCLHVDPLSARISISDGRRILNVLP